MLGLQELPCVGRQASRILLCCCSSLPLEQNNSHKSTPPSTHTLPLLLNLRRRVMAKLHCDTQDQVVHCDTQDRVIHCDTEDRVSHPRQCTLSFLTSMSSYTHSALVSVEERKGEVIIRQRIECTTHATALRLSKVSKGGCSAGENEQLCRLLGPMLPPTQPVLSPA